MAWVILEGWEVVEVLRVWVEVEVIEGPEAWVGEDDHVGIESTSTS